MKSSHKLDMTSGPILKLVLLFAIPIYIGNLLQRLYTTVDTLIIGNFCSSASLAAVGTGTQPVDILLCVFLGLGTGVSILVSQYTGKGDMSALKIVTSTATSFLFLCAVPISILGLFLGPLVLRLMNCPADSWDYAVIYIRILFLGTLGNMGYNMNAGILRGLGDSRSTLLFLFLSCIINIILDLVFVAVFQMDVTGAALATIIAMFASWIASVLYIRRKYPELEFSVLPRKMDSDLLKEIISIGLPLGLNNSIYTIGHIMMQALINAQGSSFMAACAIGSKLMDLANTAVVAFSSSATTFAGQNLGAERYTRLQKGARQIPFWSGVLTLGFGTLLTILAHPVLRLFTADPVVLKLGVTYVRAVLPFCWAYAIFNAIIYYANGIGEVRYPTIVNILLLWVVRIPCAHLIARYINGHYIMASISISFLFGLAAMLLFFRTRRWREILVLAQHDKESA